MAQFPTEAAACFALIKLYLRMRSVTSNRSTLAQPIPITACTGSPYIGLMNPNKALWEKGDFTRIAEAMRVSGEELVSQLRITKGMRVLDLGCGDGTTALPEARLGADVLGVDIAANLVAAGNARAEAEGLTNCQFQEGDACDLEGLANDSFDLVVSIFGAMFAPRPADVAKEMVRVTRSGGRIVMGNWIPGDPTLVAQILRIAGAFTPPPPEGFISPMTWGVESDVVDRFVQAGIEADRIAFARQTYTFEYNVPPTELLSLFRNYYGPTMNAYAAAEAAGRTEELDGELSALFNGQNTSGDPSTTVIPATFLQVTVTV
jgi:SAM-dependent methyltransferase